MLARMSRSRHPDDRERETAARPVETQVAAHPPGLARAENSNHRAVAAMANADPLARAAWAHGVQRSAGNAALQRAIVAREWTGPSYARHGPDDGLLEKRRMAMSGGAVASSQEVDNACADAVVKIGKAVVTLYKTGDDIHTRATKGKLVDDKDLLEQAKQVKGAAKALTDVKEGIEKLRKKGFDFSGTSFENDPELPKALGLLKASVDSFAQAPETEQALANFEANPSKDTANAWATQIGKQFAAAKTIVGALPFPPGCKWMQDYFVGLLGAPAAYIAAFQELMKYRYGKLDDEAGLSDASHRLTEGDKIVWQGPSCDLIQAAWFFDQNLQNWFRRHRKIDGYDLWEIKTDVVVALAIKEIQGDQEINDDQRKRWTAWLSGEAAPKAVP
jgi:hypothetical protein